MKSDAGPANRQPLTLSRQDSCVCSATLLVLVHLKTTHVLYEQPSAGCLWTGNAHLVDQDEPGFERLSSTFSSIISESTLPGSVRRTVPSGANSWRWLCPVKDAPPDDDELDFISFHYYHEGFVRSLGRFGQVYVIQQGVCFVSND